MLTHKKRNLFQKITIFALAISLIQACWAGLTLDDNKLANAQDIDESYGAGVDAQFTNLNLKQSIKDDSSILNINSPSARTKGSTLKLDGSSKITESLSKITLSLRDSDVRQVLRMFADKSGLNVIFHSSVEGKVTLDLVDVTLNDAFLLVLRSSELTYIKDGKNLIVSSQEASKSLGYAKQNLTVIPIKYVDASSVAKFLNKNIFSANITGLSSREIVTSNPRQNEIMIFGSDNDVAIANKIVTQLDTKPMMNSFKVNHVTPKEMASLICDALIPSSSSLSSTGDASTAAIDDSTAEEDAEEDEIKAVKLGGGLVACRAASADSVQSTGAMGGGSSADGTSTSMISFPTTPLTISYFADLGTISVYGGSVEQVQVIDEFIKQNDKKQPMAYIEMSVVELNETGSKEFENEWQMWTPFLSIGFNGTDGLSTNDSAPTFLTGDKYPVYDLQNPGNIKYTVNKYTGSSTIAYKLRYLVQNGKGRVLTNPKIMVTNGQKSVIDLTSDYVKTVTSEMSTTTAQAIVTKQYDIGNDEGLSIELIPFISPDGYVSMNIVPNFSTVKEQVKSTGQTGDTDIVATLLQRRNLKLNNLRIKDGETLVIAGLIKESERQSVTKVPILGDLPLVGVFFRSSTNHKEKEELVIMITPHIVYSQEQVKEIKSVDLL